MEKTLHELKTYAETLTTKEISYLNFNPEMDSKTLYNLLKRGWWHIYFIGTNRDLNFGLRISPDSTFSKWPVCSSYEDKNSYIAAPGLDSFFFLNLAKQLIKPQIIGQFASIVDEVEKISSRFLEITGGKENFLFFKDFFINPPVFPENESQESELYVAFWNHFDRSYGHQCLREVINSIDNMSFSPLKTYDINKLGIWKHRMFYIAVQQACKNNTDLSVYREMCDYFWEFFKNINVYDCENMYPKQFPNDSTQVNFELVSPVKMLALVVERELEKYKHNPLAAAVLKLDEDMDTYSGKEHLEAAAWYDDKMDRPDIAWNCLVNSAYWSGLNAEETLLPAWESAIYLAEKYNWKDTHKALKKQYDWYIDYKKQNNLLL